MNTIMAIQIIKVLGLTSKHIIFSSLAWQKIALLKYTACYGSHRFLAMYTDTWTYASNERPYNLSAAAASGRFIKDVE